MESCSDYASIVQPIKIIGLIVAKTPASVPATIDSGCLRYSPTSAKRASRQRHDASGRIESRLQHVARRRSVRVSN